eukprot:TRINITY_DN30764_c0_g1_i1.p1 TRINITY_DN30764_c0_g1~~TRINITY_DN30764_c0_g1_i1.p1  ORF type:complete len:1396 (-),score=366.78 TRINITY_DN30764_c0_g1_i1:262-4377(-)
MAYSPGDVDKVVADFEDFAAKLLAVAGSMVKRQAKEKDVFKSAEEGREILEKAIKGDKQKLDEIFGGSCERIGRLRVAYESLADLGLEKDLRWKHLIDRIETVESILKDLGSFKPFKKSLVQPPESLKYKAVRRRVSPGRQLRLRPELVGGECTFTVEGDLPEGLKLDPTTGEVTGSVAQQSSEVKFCIVAKNAEGEARCECVFAVTEPPPRGLQYPNLEGMLLVGANAVFQPVLDAGLGRFFKVDPALPAGLSLNDQSGDISGAPEAAQASATYKVTASNHGGECFIEVTFGAVVPPPAGLSYAVPEEWPQGRSVHYEPEMQDGVPTDFTVKPSLPEGLVLDKVTGVIRGSPSVAADAQEYVILASNEGGKTSTTIAFSVVSTAPSSLEYPGLQPSYTNATMVHLVPKLSGGAPDLFAVEPELPEGLVLSPVNGEIGGVPSALCSDGSWKVTATNAAGSCDVTLQFSVTRAPPQALSYPAAVPVYAARRPLEIVPSVEGEVDEFAITPALPEGLALDPKTGIVSGTAGGSSPKTPYKVKASNDIGSTETVLEFEVKVMPPTGLAFPGADDLYSVGEAVQFTPEVEGGAEKFSVEPALPKGLELDPVTGVVSGSPEEVVAVRDYVFTVSNEGGSTSSTVTFEVQPRAPSSLSYPSLGGELVLEENVEVDPEIDSGNFTFTVSPALPAGLSLDPKTGRIAGLPTEETYHTNYCVTASNVAGSVSVEFSLVVTTPPEEAVIDTAFAEVIEEITEVEALLEHSPPKEKRFGDWMIWMVHRAYLNDPTLTDFNFNHCRMPLPHEEWRVAPKLIKALETNTHIQNLSLAGSNLQKPQGHELAAALRKNCTIKVLNIESNKLDSSCMQDVAEGIENNKNTALEQLRVSYQLGMGKFYGRPVEQAFGEMMKTNETIVKLGLVLDDRHWMNTINGYLTRNADRARRRRKKADNANTEEELPIEEKTMSRVHLEQPPSVPCDQIMSDDSIGYKVFLKYLSNNKMVPAPTQLQNFAKSEGQPLKYSELKPTIEASRTKLLKAAVGTQATVLDSFNATMDGTFLKATVQGTNWCVELKQDRVRLQCKSAKDPGITISEHWKAWLEGKAVVKEPPPAPEAEEPVSEEVAAPVAPRSVPAAADEAQKSAAVPSSNAPGAGRSSQEESDAAPSSNAPGAGRSPQEAAAAQEPATAAPEAEEDAAKEGEPQPDPSGEEAADVMPTEVPEAQKTQYEWVKFERGDKLPVHAVRAGETDKDGPVYVARNLKGEPGKLNLDGIGENLCNLWCHHGGESHSGQIFCLKNDTHVEWKPCKSGERIPDAAVCAGHTTTDGRVYVARVKTGACGKANVSGGRVHNFWVHEGGIQVFGATGKYNEGEVLCIAPK